MGKRIPVNFFSRKSDKTQADRHYMIDKESRIFEFVVDSTGILDLYTDDAIKELKNTPRSTNKRLLWITESKAYRKDLFEYIEKDTSKIFSEWGLDGIITYEEDLLRLDKRFLLMKGCGTWIKYPGIYKKTRLCSMITSNKKMTRLQKIRVETANSVKKMGVDVYGKGFKEISRKEEGLCDYMYSIAIENKQTNSYFTEKILDCFATGTIPVYIGAKNIAKYFDQRGIIIVKDRIDFGLMTPKNYINSLEAIKNNLRIAMQYENPIEEVLLNCIDEEKSYIKNLIINI